jgi:hypothetical protein
MVSLDMLVWIKAVKERDTFYLVDSVAVVFVLHR